MPKISVIMPCFNEEAVLPRLFERMAAAAAGWGMEAEFLCVDDGSRDRTWELLKTRRTRAGTACHSRATSATRPP